MIEESKNDSTATPDPNELSRFLNVRFTISIEFGRTKMSLRDILGLSKGSVVSIPKSAGENVELLANDKLIGYGEIITVEEAIGVVITEICNE